TSPCPTSPPPAKKLRPFPTRRPAGKGRPPQRGGIVGGRCRAWGGSGDGKGGGGGWGGAGARGSVGGGTSRRLGLGVRCRSSLNGSEKTGGRRAGESTEG